MTPAIPHTQLTDGYAIPRIINGGWQLAAGHNPHIPDPERGMAHLFQLAEAGLTAFDCADIYTGVETRLGKFIRAYRRRFGESAPPIRIHTKYVPDQAALPRLTRGQVALAVDRSLKRLGLDRLDLVQFHWWDFGAPGYVDAAGWLEDLRKEGKIRHIGVTNFGLAPLGELVLAKIPIVSNQVQYSLLDRRPEHGLAEFCLKQGIGLLCYGTLAGGFLSKKYLAAADPGERFSNRSLVKYRLIIEEFGGWAAFQNCLGLLHRLAKREDASISNIASAWALSRPGVAAVIIGAPNARHLRDNLRLFNIRLQAEDIAALETFLARHPGPRGDAFSLERQPGGRHNRIMKTNLNSMLDST